MGTNQIIFFLILFFYSSSSASQLTKTLPSVEHLQENKAGRTIGEESKLSEGGRGIGGGGQVGQNGQTDGSNGQNPHGSSAVIPIYAANAHHNNNHNAATRPENHPTTIAVLLFSITLLAFIV